MRATILSFLCKPCQYFELSNHIIGHLSSNNDNSESDEHTKISFLPVRKNSTTINEKRQVTRLLKALRVSFKLLVAEY